MLHKSIVKYIRDPFIEHNFEIEQPCNAYVGSRPNGTSRKMTEVSWRNRSCGGSARNRAGVIRPDSPQSSLVTILRSEAESSRLCTSRRSLVRFLKGSNDLTHGVQ